MASTDPGSSAPYYYGQLKNGKKTPIARVSESQSVITNQTPSSSSNGQSPDKNSVSIEGSSSNNNTSSSGTNTSSLTNEVPEPSTSGLGLIKQHSSTDDSPSSSSISSRPSSSRGELLLAATQSAYGAFGGGSIASAGSGHSSQGIYSIGRLHNVPPPAAFANPLLGIEPDLTGSESLPRPTRQNKPPPGSRSGQGSKQGNIYKRSLSIITNGVSPLLSRKKNSLPSPNLHTATSPSSTVTTNTSVASLASVHLQPAQVKQQQPSPEVESSNIQGVEGICESRNSRRKSEPVMFGLDSISNEVARLQQRQDQILENMNIDFEKMLLSDGDSAFLSNVSNGNQRVVPTAALAGRSLPRDVQPPTTDGFVRPQLPRPLHAQAPMYKDPLYMMYGDGGGYGTRPEENIYEEVDLLTLNSLRAQYADTLSLQSWKKKNGSKRALSSAASSSFSRWFSTRKKSPLVGGDGDENPYMDSRLSKKQRPPISLPDIPPEGLTAEQLKRRYILSSIVESENSYISSLHRLINEYKKPLEETAPTILSQNKINVIFYRLEQILQCHAIFGIALNQCVREWDTKERLGDVFIASFSKTMVLDIYSDFINNFTSAMETARKASKSKSAFAQFLQEKSLSSPDRLSFFGLMVKPVQRFPQFILLLNDLLKHTPPDHPDRMSLQLALTQLEALADRLNERKRDAERHFAVKQLLKDYLSGSTATNNRYLLRMDEVYLLDLDPSTGLVAKTKCRKLFLLNDLLVCVSLPSNRLKFAVALQEIDIVDDVTPASTNLVANSVLKTKDARTGSVSPQNCSVERMYSDLNNLIHDLEIMSRVTNLVSSLRYQYNGLSPEISEQISNQIRNEIRRKDAQITLIDRSCFQLRIRSKNYKDVVCIQMSDPEAKRDWLTDVRLAKLALDRGNNPAWDVLQDVSASSGNIHAMTQQRVPLFVKSLPIFATSESSQLTCALFYQLDPAITGTDVPPSILWICNVNESGSQLGALATSGADVSLIHSYELCDSQVTCLESVGSFTVWIGLKQGRVIVIDATSPGEWRQFVALEVVGEVTCMRHFGPHVYVGLKTGCITIFDVAQYNEVATINVSPSPVNCLILVESEIYASCGSKIWVLRGPKIERSHSLNENEDNSGNNTTGPRPYLLAHCGIGLWVSLADSSVIRLYHTETFKHLQDLNVASNVKRVLTEVNDYNVVVTSMLATRGLLWVGTNVGVIVTLTLPRLQGVPLASSGALNVSLHRHLGPVTILLNLTPGAEAPVSTGQGRSSRNDRSRRTSLEVKHEDMESIYGLYSDLMKVGDFGGTRRPPQAVNASRMGWDLSAMAISDESNNSDAANAAMMYHDANRMARVPRHVSPTDASNAVSAELNSLKQGAKTTENGEPQQVQTPGSEDGAICGQMGSGNVSTTPYGDIGSRPMSQRSQGVVQSSMGRSREQLYSGSDSGSCSVGGLKTALLVTGGNGYKRNSNENPYSSQHAHCIIWEYKL